MDHINMRNIGQGHGKEHNAKESEAGQGIEESEQRRLIGTKLIEVRESRPV